VKKILAIVAHPDDEVLGLGGTLCKHVNMGHETKVLILSDGESSRNFSTEDQLKSAIDKRKNAACSAGKIIGYGEPLFGSFKDNSFDSSNLLDIVKFIEHVVEDFVPNVIYTHCSHDLNIDHQITNEAVIVASRPKAKSSIEAVYAFETLSSTEWSFNKRRSFQPNLFINIESEMDKKLQALKCYDNEMLSAPNSRSYEAVQVLGKRRGFQVGIPCAESFEVIREIKK